MPTTSQNITFFEPQLEGFIRQLKRLHNRIALSGHATSSWARLPVYEDFEAACIVALRAYLHLNHGHIYLEHYRRVTTADHFRAQATVDTLRVPLYVYSMIRELSRPMYLSDHECLLPYLPLVTSDEERGQGPVPGLGFKAVRDPAVSAMLSGWFPREELVPIVKEEAPLVQVPAFVCEGPSLAIYDVHSLKEEEPLLPEYRLKSCCILRHLQPSCTFYKAYFVPAPFAEGPMGGAARFHRCDQDFTLQHAEDSCRPAEDMTQASSSQLSQEFMDAEGLKEVCPCPQLLQHLLDSLQDTLGYKVPFFSTQGLDTTVPFPTDWVPAGGAEATSKKRGLFGLSK